MQPCAVHDDDYIIIITAWYDHVICVILSYNSSEHTTLSKVTRKLVKYLYFFLNSTQTWCQIQWRHNKVWSFWTQNARNTDVNVANVDKQSMQVTSLRLCGKKFKNTKLLYVSPRIVTSVTPQHCGCPDYSCISMKSNCEVLAMRKRFFLCHSYS